MEDLEKEPRASTY